MPLRILHGQCGGAGAQWGLDDEVDHSTGAVVTDQVEGQGVAAAVEDGDVAGVGDVRWCGHLDPGAQVELWDRLANCLDGDRD